MNGRMEIVSRISLVFLLGGAILACGAERSAPKRGGKTGTQIPTPNDPWVGSGGSGGSAGSEAEPFGCEDECPRENQIQCRYENAFMRCAQFDDDECLEWGPDEACDIGHVCDVTTQRCIIPECQPYTSACGGQFGGCCPGLHCCQGDCHSPGLDGWCLKEVGEYADGPGQCTTGRWNATTRKCST
jgi:hypothetical protein